MVRVKVRVRVRCEGQVLGLGVRIGVRVRCQGQVLGLGFEVMCKGEVKEITYRMILINQII